MPWIESRRTPIFSSLVAEWVVCLEEFERIMVLMPASCKLDMVRRAFGYGFWPS